MAVEHPDNVSPVEANDEKIEYVIELQLDLTSSHGVRDPVHSGTRITEERL